jgi:chloramphenicol-sensitive protein RarD
VSDEDASTRTGFLLGTFAYFWWGMVPLYFSALKDHAVPAVEILAHRIVWSLPIMLLITAIAGTWKPLGAVFRSRKLLLLMLLSSGLLAVNWLLYIYATIVGKVVEGSLGYYMLPLVNAFLGTVFLGEKLRPAHYPALGIIAVGLAFPFVVAGQFTWLAVTLPVTFGLYGFVRKAIPVDSLSGLTVESLMMLPFALAGLAWLGASGDGHFGASWGLNALLAFSGIVTVAPLLTYIMSIRRLPLVAMSFLQFISPTTQLLIALFFLGESPPWYVWVACSCVWVSVAIFLGDAAWQYAGARKKRAEVRELRAPILVSAKA